MFKLLQYLSVTLRRKPIVFAIFYKTVPDLPPVYLSFFISYHLLAGWTPDTWAFYCLSNTLSTHHPESLCIVILHTWNTLRQRVQRPAPRSRLLRMLSKKANFVLLYLFNIFLFRRVMNTWYNITHLFFNATCLSSRLVISDLVYVAQGPGSGDGHFTQAWPFLATVIHLGLDKWSK